MTQIFRESPNQLLEIMTARGAIAWNNPILKNIKRELFRALLFGLEMLAHIEADIPNRLYVCRPTFVVPPQNDSRLRLVLCGARTRGTYRELEEIIEAKKLNGLTIKSRAQSPRKESVKGVGQIDVTFPELILLEVDNPEQLEELARTFDIQLPENDTPLAWSLLKNAVSLEEWETSLEDWENAPSDWSSPRKLGFDIKKIRWQPYENRPTDKSSLRQYSNGYKRDFILYDGEGGRRFVEELDYARYSVLAKRDRNVLLYDVENHRLAVPSGARLPILYRRALTLCTGMMPKIRFPPIPREDYREGIRCEVYDGIPHSIALLVAEKMGQKLTHRRFE